MNSFLRQLFTPGSFNPAINSHDVVGMSNRIEDSQTQTNILKENRLRDLPEKIYYSLRDYLTQDDYQQLLNTSKRIFLEIRRKSIIYQLTEKYSIKYCENEHYRNQLTEKVENPFKQIIIKLTHLDIKKHEEVLDLIPVYLICTSFPRDPRLGLRSLKELPTRNPGIFLFLRKVKEFTASDPGFPDISLLKDCENIAVDNCDHISDGFSSLGRQRSFYIKDNPHLTNVLNLRFIRTLTLVNCENLVDVSSLHGVYDLSLIYCWAIKDISSLGDHHRLEVSKCIYVRWSNDVLKNLQNIPVVKLFDSMISDVSFLSNAKVVHLEDCPRLVDVSPLREVRELTLKDCCKIEDISMLTTVQKLTILKLPNLKNYERMNQMMNLSLQVDDPLLLRVPNVKSIECCYYSAFQSLLPRLSSFSNLHCLTVRRVAIKIKISLSIHTVILDDCEVENISGLGKNRVVRLFRCRGDVVDVSGLATVPVVSFIYCDFKKVNYERLKKVPRLKLLNWSG